jgi:hypothetical protein
MIVFEVGNFVFELATPYTLSACAVSKRITGLPYHQHESRIFIPAYLDHKLPYDVVVIAVPCVGDKILDGLWRDVRKESDVDVSISGMDDGRRSSFGALPFRLSTLS